MKNTELIQKLKQISAEIALGESTRLEHVQLVDDLVAEIQADEATEMAYMGKQVIYNRHHHILMNALNRVDCR